MTRSLLFFIMIYVTLSMGNILENKEKIIKICAFNVQIFGKSKMEKPGVPEILVKIFRKYDIALIQEIRDSSNTYIHTLKDMINNCTNCDQYNLTLSERLGRTSSKEQYGFFFKNSEFEILNTNQFNVSLDYFERPNYSVEFKVNGFNDSFFLSANHISPSKAPEEIDRLVDVYDTLINQYGFEKKILFMGDFNADCSYVSQNDWKSIRLRNDTSRFNWYLDDNADTNLGAESCAYDRFVGNNKFDRIFLNGTQNVLRFDLDFNLTIDEAKTVSDHYPIELKIKIFQSNTVSIGTTIESSIILLMLSIILVLC
eukprot:gene1127-10641_t